MSLESISGYDKWKTATPYDDETFHFAGCPNEGQDGHCYECDKIEITLREDFAETLRGDR